MAITFTVNLETLNNLSCRQPYSKSEAANFKMTRIAYFPDNLIDNHNLVHGSTLVVSGATALYLNNNYTTGPYAFLTYVSGTAY